MILSQQQRDGLMAQVTASAVASPAKERILSLLAQPELSTESLAEIRSLIDADIRADIATVLPDFEDEMSKDPEAQAILAEGEAKTKAVADDLDDSMRFVGEQTRQIEQATLQLTDALSKVDANDLKAKMGIAS